MPAQSGSTTVLARMRRGYTRDAYDALLQRVYNHLPQARSCFTSDRRAGGCLERGGVLSMDLLQRYTSTRRRRTAASPGTERWHMLSCCGRVREGRELADTAAGLHPASNTACLCGHQSRNMIAVLSATGSAAPAVKASEQVACVGQAALSTDMISGFCGETEAEHAGTLELMRGAAFEQAFMFAYSQREKTIAARTLADDVPPAVKARPCSVPCSLCSPLLECAHSHRSIDASMHLGWQAWLAGLQYTGRLIEPERDKGDLQGLACCLAPARHDLADSPV